MLYTDQLARALGGKPFERETGSSAERGQYTTVDFADRECVVGLRRLRHELYIIGQSTVL